MFHFVRAEQAIPGLRGGQFLRVVLGRQLHRVWTFPGHILVSFDSGTRLMCFDSVPSSQQLNESQAHDIRDALESAVPSGTHGLLLTKLSSVVCEIIMLPPDDSIAQKPAVSSPINGGIGSAKLSSASQLYQQHQQKDLRLVAVSRNGTVDCFCFRVLTGKWERVTAALPLPQPPSLASLPVCSVVSMTYHANSSRLVWCQETGDKLYSVFSCMLTLTPGITRPLEWGTMETLVTGSRRLRIVPLSDYIALLPAPLKTPPEYDPAILHFGLFMNISTRKRHAYLFNYGFIPAEWVPVSEWQDLRRLSAWVAAHLAELPNVEKISNDGQVFWQQSHAAGYPVALTLDPLAQRLASIDDDGCAVLFSCDSQANATRFPTKLSMQSESHVFFYNNFLCLYHPELNDCDLLDSRGTRLSYACSLPLNDSGGEPSSNVIRLLDTGLGQICPTYLHAGVCRSDAVWLLRQKNVTDMAQSIVDANAESPTNCLAAALLCNDWGLHELATKYKLDAVLAWVESHDQDAPQTGTAVSKAALDESLLASFATPNRMQSPALLVAGLVDQPSMDELSKAMVQEWLALYQNSGSGSTDSTSSKLDGLQKALWLHTPLNAVVASFFERYHHAAMELKNTLSHEHALKAGDLSWAQAITGDAGTVTGPTVVSFTGSSSRLGGVSGLRSASLPPVTSSLNPVKVRQLQMDVSAAASISSDTELRKTIEMIGSGMSTNPARVEALVRHEGVRLLRFASEYLMLPTLVDESVVHGGGGGDLTHESSLSAQLTVSSSPVTPVKSQYSSLLHDAHSNNSQSHSSKSSYQDTTPAFELIGHCSKDYSRLFSDDILLYELVCRLLLVHSPTRLVPFVQFAQAAVIANLSGFYVPSSTSSVSAVSMGDSGTSLHQNISTSMYISVMLNNSGTLSHSSSGHDIGLGRPRTYSGMGANIDPSTRGRYFSRAVNTLSPVLVGIDDTGLSSQSIRACASLLCSNFVNAAPAAMRLLLRWRLYEDGLQLLAMRSKHDVEHYELFHVILASFIDTNVLNTYASRLWVLMPRNYSPRELFSVLRDRLSVVPRNHTQAQTLAAQSGIWAQPDEPSVGTIVPKLLSLGRQSDRAHEAKFE